MSELVFVYLGERLPSYALSSLELARRHAGLKVCLIAERRALTFSERPNLRLVPLEEFYDPSEFAATRGSVSYSHEFRDGFWLKTIERLFVLEQFWGSEPSDSLFHAELDQLLFRADLLVQQLNQHLDPALFLPFHNERAAVASVLVCNSPSVLRSIINFSQSVGEFNNEMELLARWASLNPSWTIALPTLADRWNRESRNFLNAFAKMSSPLDGVVDAAQLGQWVAGIDPRNVGIEDRPRNKFVDPPDGGLLTAEQLRKIRFSRFHNGEGGLFCSDGDADVSRVFNLHIHSKVHHYLQRSDPSLMSLFETANRSSSSTFPGTRRAQLVYQIPRQLDRYRRRPDLFFRAMVRKVPLPVRKTLRPVLGCANRARRMLSRELATETVLRRGMQLFGWRPPSTPYVAMDSFRALSDFVVETDSQPDSRLRIRPNSIVFCEPRLLDHCVREVKLGSISGITLLVGNGDESFTLRHAALCRQAGFSKVFAQNLVEEIPGVGWLPIGLENRWRSRNGATSDFSYLRQRLPTKINRVAWSFDVETNPSVRNLAREQLISCSVADNIGQLTARQHRRALAKYAFVAAPPGNGPDTHRTWEAMYLRCIPILIESRMARNYERQGFPVLIVEEYSELNRFTEESLEEEYQRLARRFSNEALWMPFWRSELTKIRGM